MRLSRRMVVLGMSVISLMVLAMILSSSVLVKAAGPAKVQHGPAHAHQQLRKGPVKLPTGKTQPLHRTTNPPRPPHIAHGALVTPALHNASATLLAAATTCAQPTIDMKILVIAADGNEADLPAIQQALDYLGTPYTVYIAAKTPNGLTTTMLSNGCHGYYQGVILTDGELAYYNGSAWVSALSSQEWTNLWSYQAALGVREVSWYTYPTADFGYQSPSSAVDTTAAPVNIKLTTQGQAVFSYMNSTTTVPVQNAYTYLAQPLTDGNTTSLLTDANGNALAAIRNYTDGRQTLSLTFDSNPNLIHNIVLSYGLINWLTKGVFLGERHVYMSPQIDDVFIDDSDWQANTVCGTNPDATGYTYRITGTDYQAVLNWQNGKHAVATTSNIALTMAFNGYGTIQGAYTPDTLTPTAKSNQAPFYWVSHTWDHTNLDAISYKDATSEIVQNNQAATTMGFSHYNRVNMVTPDVSGLTNPNFLQAAYDNGIRYLVTDTSRAGYNNPSSNAGIYNSYQPQILMLPRRPNNLFYNVSTPAAWVSEYNCIYQSFWGHALTYQQILDVESQTLLTYMLKGDIDPWMFHQPNMRAYDGTHTLLGDLLDMMLQKYQQYYNLKVISPTMDSLGKTVANRMKYNASGVTASIVPGVSITITAQKAARIPITGLNSSGAETYGGQHITYVNLSAGQTVTLPWA